MVIASDYPFLDIVGTMAVFFFWLAWVYILVVILGDVFRRSDLSGWGKAGWTLLVVVLPWLGTLIYLIAHGREIGERRMAEGEARQLAYSEHVREVAGTAGPTDQIAKAKRLLDTGAIDQAEFTELKRRALA